MHTYYTRSDLLYTGENTGDSSVFGAVLYIRMYTITWHDALLITYALVYNNSFKSYTFFVNEKFHPLAHRSYIQQMTSWSDIGFVSCCKFSWRAGVLQVDYISVKNGRLENERENLAEGFVCQERELSVCCQEAVLPALIMINNIHIYLKIFFPLIDFCRMSMPLLILSQ